LPEYYFLTDKSQSRLRSGRKISGLVFQPTDKFYKAQSKILARTDELETIEKEAQDIDEVTLVGSGEEMYVLLIKLTSLADNSQTPSHIDDSADLAAMLEAFANISDSAREVKEGVFKRNVYLRALAPQAQAAV